VYAEVGTLTGTELGNAGLVVGDDTAGVLLGAAVTLMGATLGEDDAGLVVGDDTAGVLLGAAVTLMGATLGPATTGFPVDTGTATGVGTL